MQLTKTLTSALAAAGLVGAIGLAYAQTTTEPAPAPSTTQTAPPEPSTSTTPTTPPASSDTGSTMSTPSTSTDSSTLAPQADRN